MIFYSVCDKNYKACLTPVPLSWHKAMCPPGLQGGLEVFYCRKKWHWATQAIFGVCSVWWGQGRVGAGGQSLTNSAGLRQGWDESFLKRQRALKL